MNCIHSFRTKNNFESYKKECENKNFCNAIMPSDDIKILESNRYQKSDKVPSIISEYLECMIEKIDGSKKN